jgi:hypothetical protein
MKNHRPCMQPSGFRDQARSPPVSDKTCSVILTLSPCSKFHITDWTSLQTQSMRSRRAALLGFLVGALPLGISC